MPSCYGARILRQIWRSQRGFAQYEASAQALEIAANKALWDDFGLGAG
jgi:hypothetical protein